MSATLKFLHIAAIAIWAAGLVCFPYLVRQRNDMGQDTDLHRLHSMARFFYVVILSPAAFIAIGSGTALIFQQETFTAWFSLKLLLVGLLAALHLITGRYLLRVFDKSSRMPSWRYQALTISTIAVVTGILTVVLIKPQLDVSTSAPEFFAPGRLGDLFSATGSGHSEENHLLSRIDHQTNAVIEDQLAAMPAGQTREDGGEYGERQAVGQHLLWGGEPQAPIGARDGEQRHGCDSMRPATDSVANAGDGQQFSGADERCGYSQPERESRTPNARAQEEWIAEVPVENIDAQRREH